MIVKWLFELLRMTDRRARRNMKEKEREPRRPDPLPILEPEDPQPSWPAAVDHHRSATNQTPGQGDIYHSPLDLDAKPTMGSDMNRDDMGMGW